MGGKSRKWINEHRKELEAKHGGKIIIVCEDKIVRVFDEPINPIDINKIARKICGEKDWSYTYLYTGHCIL